MASKAIALPLDQSGVYVFAFTDRTYKLTGYPGEDSNLHCTASKAVASCQLRYQGVWDDDGRKEERTIIVPEEYMGVEPTRLSPHTLAPCFPHHMGDIPRSWPSHDPGCADQHMDVRVILSYRFGTTADLLTSPGK